MNKEEKLNNILIDIILNKKKELEEKKNVLPLNKLLEYLEKNVYKNRDFKNSIKRKPNKISLIAECKKSSPSVGILRENFDPIDIAKQFENAKVDAISVLTENKYFLGNELHLIDVRKNTFLPILRKDFIVDEYQVFESKYLKADAILLIVGILSREELKNLYTKAKELHLDVLVEIHTLKDIQKLEVIDPDIIGINNRNLFDFSVDITTTEKLSRHIPQGKIIVSESGIKDKNDVKYICSIGVDCILVGTNLMKKDNLFQAIKELMSE
ncbi:MAG: indole-3-glycerol phosphate synthase TrpC [Endomicrobia bacterium]|nr:indole-3-glycerol phosphate synthase TrpC [Endomicrobiia bacterium]